MIISGTTAAYLVKAPMAVDELVCSCNPQALDGSGDIIAAHQQTKVQELQQYSKRTTQGVSRDNLCLAAWVVGGFYADFVCC